METMLPGLTFRGTCIPFPDKGSHRFFDPTSLEVSTPVHGGTGAPGLCLFRAESGVCGIIPIKMRVIHRKTQVAGLAVLHHGDALEIDGAVATFRELSRLTLAADHHLVSRPCPYCREEHTPEKTVVRCPIMW